MVLRATTTLTTHRWSRLLALALLLLGCGTSQAEQTLESREWRQVRSENFQINGVLSEARTTELLRHLEIMRSSLGDASAPASGSDARTVILAVDNHDDYVAIGAPAYTAGFFFSDLRENAILIEDSDKASGIQVILHEYAHFLNKQSSRIRYPRWYEEGNAEYLSHSRLREQAFEFGLPPGQYLATLSFSAWLPLRQTLALTDVSTLDEDEGALFYAQSWLLVHYLRSLPDADQAMPGMLQDYARLVSAGTSTIPAFEQAFGMDVDALEDMLLRYFLEREFISRSVAANTAMPGFVTRTRALSQAEAQLALAQMALRFENIAGAELWFNAVLADNDLRAHGEAGLGRVLGYRGDVDGANEHFDTAIKLMAWDFDIWMDYAQYWAQRISTAYDAKSRERYASRLIESLESALTISDATPELNSLMGFAYLAKGRDVPGAIDYLEAAADAAPHDQASRLLLANAYLYVARYADAIDVAESVLLFEHQPNDITDAAHDVITEARRKRLR
jgi:tetratricopeptide (TPR) repeat protein